MSFVEIGNSAGIAPPGYDHIRLICLPGRLEAMAGATCWRFAVQLNEAAIALQHLTQSPDCRDACRKQHKAIVLAVVRLTAAFEALQQQLPETPGPEATVWVAQRVWDAVFDDDVPDLADLYDRFMDAVERIGVSINSARAGDAAVFAEVAARMRSFAASVVAPAA